MTARFKCLWCDQKWAASNEPAPGYIPERCPLCNCDDERAFVRNDNDYSLGYPSFYTAWKWPSPAQTRIAWAVEPTIS